MADRIVSVDENYIFPEPLETRLGAKIEASPKVAEIESRELPDRGRLIPANYPGGISTVNVPGTYSVWTGSDATALGLPITAAAEVHVYGFGASMTYRVYSFTSAGTVENVRRSSSGVWASGWARQTPSDTETANFIKNGVDTPREIQAMIDAAGGINTRLVPLSLTTGASSADAAVEGTVRYPIHFSPVIGRWRLRIVDVNPRYGSNRTGNSTIEHVLIGAHAGDGAFKVKPTQVAASGNIPAGKDGWTSPWMDHQLGASQQLLSFSYVTAGGLPCALPGAGWQGSRSVAQELAPSFGGPAVRMPFHVWIEAEVDSRVRVIAALGSSSACGQGATYPVLESFVSQHARRVGALPVHYTAAGTTIEDWDLPTHYKWTMQDIYTTPDALAWNIGSNNIYGDTPLASMISSSTSLLGLLEARGISHIYAANIPPRAATTTERTNVRLGYNDWMRTSGEFKDLFDFASALSSDGLVMDPEYDSGDGTHYNSAGHDRTVTTITANMATAPLVNV